MLTTSTTSMVATILEKIAFAAARLFAQRLFTYLCSGTSSMTNQEFFDSLQNGDQFEWIDPKSNDLCRGSVPYTKISDTMVRRHSGIECPFAWDRKHGSENVIGGDASLPCRLRKVEKVMTPRKFFDALAVGQMFTFVTEATARNGPYTKTGPNSVLGKADREGFFVYDPRQPSGFFVYSTEDGAENPLLSKLRLVTNGEFWDALPIGAVFGYAGTTRGTHEPYTKTSATDITGQHNYHDSIERTLISRRQRDEPCFFLRIFPQPKENDVNIPQLSTAVATASPSPATATATPQNGQQFFDSLKEGEKFMIRGGEKVFIKTKVALPGGVGISLCVREDDNQPYTIAQIIAAAGSAPLVKVEPKVPPRMTPQRLQALAGSIAGVINSLNQALFLCTHCLTIGDGLRYSERNNYVAQLCSPIMYMDALSDKLKPLKKELEERQQAGYPD